MELLGHLHAIPHIGDEGDAIRWMRLKSGIFKVMSDYVTLAGNRRSSFSLERSLRYERSL